MAADLEKDWAGVLQRWGNSAQQSNSSSAGQKKVVQSASYTSTGQSYSSSGQQSYNSGQSYSSSRQSYSSSGQQSYNSSSKQSSTGGARVSSPTRNYGGLEGVQQSSWRSSRRDDEIGASRKHANDAKQSNERHQPTKTGGERKRWSIGRHSESPGKENVDNNRDYRSRSNTKSPTSRLFSSTIASRAKQINPNFSDQGNANAHKKRPSPNNNNSAGSRGRQSSSPPLKRTSKTSSSRNSQDYQQQGERRSSGSFRKSSNPGAVSNNFNNSSNNTLQRKSSGAGSVKIALSSLKKASIQSWDGNNGNTMGKKKSISSVYIG